MRRAAGCLAAVTVLGSVLGGVPGASAQEGGDPLRDAQWGLEQVRAPGAWDRGRGQGATVAVVDSGVDLTHPDLAANLLPGITFAACGDDGCGKGSWDELYPESAHPGGTQAAGVIAAVEGNGIGIAGVAPDAKILPVRVTERFGIPGFRDVALGVHWAVAQGADVINIGPTSDLWRPADIPLEAFGTRLDDARAVAEAAASGAVVVVNAGLDDGSYCQLPELAERIVCVGPTDPDQQRRGPWPYGIESDILAVTAPGGPYTSSTVSWPSPNLCGQGVLSTQPNGDLNIYSRGTCDLPAGYVEAHQASIAAAHVSGVAALLVGMGCTQESTLHILGDTARTPGGSTGDWSASHGYGIVDAAAAMARAAELCHTLPIPEDECDCEGTPEGEECECERESRCGGAITEDFGEGGLPEGWEVQTATNADDTPTWRVEWQPRLGAAATTDASGTGEKDDRLVSPAFRPNRHARVAFEHRYDLETRRDGAVLEYSVDGGDTWAQVPIGQLSSGRYDASIKDGSRITGHTAWTSLRTRSKRDIAVRSVADLGFLNRREVRLGWRLVQDPARDDSAEGRGWWIDVVELRGLRGRPCAGDDDPLRHIQYGLRHVRADVAWSRTRGAGSVVAVLDTGVDTTHPDLAGKVRPGKTFLSCGESGCGDGSWVSGSDHGTHVAGIAAASGWNGEGAAGVAPEAEILPVRVLNETGRGSMLDVALGIRWAVDNGADVVNLSLGTNPGVQILDEVGITGVHEEVEHAVANDVVVVAAAGNQNLPLCSTPAFTDDVLCVAATGANRLPADYTNLGIKKDFLTVAAPGGSLTDPTSLEPLDICGRGIVSTVPAGTNEDYCGYGPHYAEHMGTSMATPHAAGLAALLKARGCSWRQTMDLITETAQHPVTGERGAWSQPYGYGLIDAAAAVDAAAETCGG